MPNPSAGYQPEEVRRYSGPAHAKIERVLSRFGGIPDVEGRTVIVVDDGLATGLTATVAVDWLKRLGAKRVVLAIPVSSISALAALQRHADEVVSLDTPVGFYAVGQFYEHFNQTEDDEVEALLRSYAQ
ncbi:MAG: hypothetical protein HY876_07165 [Coriobacteriales bacterium]|nr:hypothetical protein [Coriobacteriales bacterium]